MSPSEAEIFRAVEMEMYGTPDHSTEKPPLPRVAAYDLGLVWTNALEENWHKLYIRCAVCDEWMPRLFGMAACTMCRAE